MEDNATRVADAGEPEEDSPASSDVESTWNGPSMSRLEEEGLGKGIDATRPEKLIDYQVLPTVENLEIVTVGTGYKEFNETLDTMASLKNSLSSSMGVEAIEVVSFKVGFEFKRNESSRKRMIAYGKQIHNETVRFKNEKISGSSIRLMDLLQEAARENGFEYSPGKDIPRDQLDRICKEVVKIRNHGATHYISSVDLGAKVYGVETEYKKKASEQTGVSSEAGGGTGEVMAKASVDFSTETKKMCARSENEIKFVVDPAVELKSEHTVIAADQEKTIAYKVTALWQLVEDRAWRESVKKACKDYVDELSPISVGPASSFLIKTGSGDNCQYLRVTEGQIVGTPDRKEAHSFTLEFPESKQSEDKTDSGVIDHVHDPENGFFLCYEEPGGGERLYITADTERGIVPQTAVEEEEQAKFFLAHPVSKHPQPISSWQDRKPLLLLRRHEKSVLHFWTEHIKSFLVLKKMADKDHLVLQEKESLVGSHLHCQFCLERP